MIGSAGRHAPRVIRTPSPHCRGTAMISVCLVDDQNLVRQGVRSLLDLAEDIRVVAECADGAQAVAEIPRIKPDVVLLDLRMPNMSGLEVLQALSARSELPPTIILTTFDDDQLVLQGLKRSEEHTSELQSRRDLVCRLLLEKKKKQKKKRTTDDKQEQTI